MPAGVCIQSTTAPSSQAPPDIETAQMGPYLTSPSWSRPDVIEWSCYLSFEWRHNGARCVHLEWSWTHETAPILPSYKRTSMVRLPKAALLQLINPSFHTHVLRYLKLHDLGTSDGASSKRLVAVCRSITLCAQCVHTLVTDVCRERKMKLKIHWKISHFQISYIGAKVCLKHWLGTIKCLYIV